MARPGGMTRAVRRAALLIVVGAAACTGPAAPEIPDDVGPPPPAANPQVCIPPYPMSFGQDWYLLADLDRGVGCVAFLERDECILGIFRDCTDESEAPRQWRGVVEQGRGIKLYPEHSATSGTLIARSPKCCLGTLPDDADPWALLSCRKVTCSNNNDKGHVGLYLERWQPDLDPTSGILTQQAIPAETAALVVASDGTLWGLGPEALFSLTPGGQAQMQATLTAGRALAASAEGVLASDDDKVARVDQANPTWRSVGGPVVALAAAPEGGWVAALDAEGGHRLAHLDAAGVVTATAALNGRVSGLAGGAAVYLTLEGDSRVLKLGSDLSLSTIVDLSVRSGQTGGAVVPRSPLALPDGKVAFVARCHTETSKTHCVFEADAPDVEPLRRGLAGVESILSVAHDPDDDRLVVTSVEGAVTVIERTTGRPHLQAQIRLGATVVTAAFSPLDGRLYAVLEGGSTLQPVDPEVW